MAPLISALEFNDIIGEGRTGTTRGPSDTANHLDIELFQVLDEPWQWQVHFAGTSNMFFHGTIGDNRQAYLILTIDLGTKDWIWAAGTPAGECEITPLEPYELRPMVYLAAELIPAPEDDHLVVYFKEPRCSGAEGPIIEGRQVQPIAIETATAVLVDVWVETIITPPELEALGFETPTGDKGSCRGTRIKWTKSRTETRSAAKSGLSPC